MIWLLALILIIDGREEKELYRVKVPDEWVHQPLTADINDTKNPIAEFTSNDLKVVIHNFPNIKIPPGAQVQRWKQQSNGTAEPVSFSGYQGLYYSADDTLGWALEIGPELRRGLEGEAGSDVTIKATGEVEKYQDDIEKFAKSFRLVQEIQAPR